MAYSPYYEDVVDGLKARIAELEARLKPFEEAERRGYPNLEAENARLRVYETLYKKEVEYSTRLREALADHACGSGCTYPTHEGLLR